jgi:hypothetical protein
MNRTPNEAIQRINSYMPRAMNNAVANISNTASNVINSANSAINKANNAFNTTVTNTINSVVGNNAISPKTNIPWLFIILGILFITAIILFVVFYDKIVAGLPDSIKNLFGTTAPAPPEVPVSGSGEEPEQGGLPIPVDNSISDILSKQVPGKKEVFTIAENRYTYSDAQPLCKSMGAELATYDQVKDAWKNGADWCNYGWVKGQRAVYPTQQETWDKIQSGPEDSRGSCGTVGINGGYFDNPELRFGVTCYGEKPSKTEHDEQVIAAEKDQAFTPSVIDFNRKVNDFKQNRGDIGILPFSNEKWNN